MRRAVDTMRPSLAVVPESGGQVVVVRSPDGEFAAAVRHYLDAGKPAQPVLRVTVDSDEAGPDMPALAGRYDCAGGALRFWPHFGLQPGVPYRAMFDPRPLGMAMAGMLRLDFTLPAADPAPPPRVEQVYPSGDALPANLLRLYVRFSNPMQRGHAGEEIVVVGADGAMASDVLYRAPVELWDRSMRHLTILLDPGRLKRGVGPHRQLGPPLAAGETYALVVGAGMRDAQGRCLAAAGEKRFRVTDACREAVDTGRWITGKPATGTREALTLTFPRALDWAMLSRAIAVTSAAGIPVEGQTSVDQHETRWRFTPALPWAAGAYALRVERSLEDVCGNDLMAAFDRPVRTARAEGEAGADIITVVLGPA